MTAEWDGGTTAAAPAPTQLAGSTEVASGAYDGVLVVVVALVVVVVVPVVPTPLARADATPITAPRTPRTRSKSPRRTRTV